MHIHRKEKSYIYMYIIKNKIVTKKSICMKRVFYAIISEQG